MHKRVIIILAVLGVDLFAAFAWLFWTETPGYVLREAGRRMAATTAVHLDADIAGEGTATLPDLPAVLDGGDAGKAERAGGFAARLSADLDLRDLGLVKDRAAFRVTVTSTQPTTDRYDGEFRAIGSDRWLRLDDLPASGGLADRLAGRWTALGPGGLDAPLLRPGTVAEVDDATGKRIRDLFRTTRFLTVTAVLPDEPVAGEMARHFTVAFRPEAARAFAILAMTARDGRSPTTEELARLDADIVAVGAGTGDIWIRTRDFFVSKVRFRGVAGGEGGAGMPYAATILLSRWNEPADIAPPEAPTPMRGLLLASGIGGLTQAGATSDRQPVTSSREGTTVFAPASDDPDGDGLTDELESFYRTDPLNPDTDGDGYRDGYEVDHGFDPTGPGELFRFGR